MFASGVFSSTLDVEIRPMLRITGATNERPVRLLVGIWILRDRTRYRDRNRFPPIPFDFDSDPDIDSDCPNKPSTLKVFSDELAALLDDVSTFGKIKRAQVEDVGHGVPNL